MTSKRELYSIVRALRQHLEWEQRAGVSGYLPASEDARQQWEAQKQLYAQRRAERLLEGSSPPEPTASTEHAPNFDPSSAIFEKPQDNLPSSPGEVSALWKQLGSMSRRTFQTMESSVPNADMPAPGAQRDDVRPTPRVASSRTGEMTAEQKLEYLRNYLGDCQRCSLCEGRTQIVYGDGSAQARLMFIGEAPGFHEDKQGIPFVGKAGELLDKMIVAMGLSRADVYIANVLKCRPPENRNPAPDEIRECAPFLLKQVDVIKPEVIVTLGKFAAQTLLKTEEPISALRGKWQSWRNFSVMPTYHPAYLLRNPQAKGDAWHDLKRVMQKLDLAGRSQP